MPPPPPTSPPSRPAATARGMRGPQPSLRRSRARRDQLLATSIGVVLLACSMFLFSRLDAFRSDQDLVREDPESEKTLRSLAISFPRLTLGGMRGLVSTYLWYKAEDDKNERRWMDLETKYDIIGALQPYFASVYIYHAWNQAYNLSAQWQEQDIKYKWVLDGLAYLYKGEEFNPGNPDIYLEEAHLYFLKLGGAAERTYYREHWRHDISRLHELNTMADMTNDDAIALQHVRSIINRNDPTSRNSYFHIQERRDDSRQHGGTGWGVTVSDPVIDPKTGFNLFKERLDGKNATEPVEFPYGLSPFYFAYIEYKRCLSQRARPTYTGIQVIDAWPAMALRLWCRDDLYYIGDTMNRLFGSNPDTSITGDPAAFNAKIAEMHLCFRNIQMIAPRAVDLFVEHLTRYPINENVHRKHILETEAFLQISKAEIKLLDALTQWQNNGRKMVLPNGQDLRPDFQEAVNLYKAAYPVTMVWVDRVYPVRPGEAPNPDRADLERYAIALQNRSRGIERLLNLGPEEKPDMSFLGGETNELVER